jgi:hypothetical protein
MSTYSPILRYLREVLDEHTLPLEDLGTGLIEATWLLDMIHKVETIYRNDGLL